MQKTGLKAFVSYSHKDEALRTALDAHLAGLVSQGIIQFWKDRAIEAGSDWDREIQEQLDAADIVLLLISADFIASPYCYGNEMQQAMQRHENGSAIVVPIILRPADWHHAPFAKLQALPKDGKAITTWPNQDEGFLDIARGLRSVASAIHARRNGDGSAPSSEVDGGPQGHTDNSTENAHADRVGMTVSRLKSETITATVKMMSLGESFKCVLPSDATVEAIIVQLVKQMDVPRIEFDGHPIAWDLASKSLGKTLNPRKTLRENNVPEGDTLHFYRELRAG